MRTLALLLFLLSSSLAGAQGYPQKPLTLIIPFPPGGSTDIVGRVAAEGLARELRQPVVVENRGGAGGAIGAKAIADAAPDGYTLGVATVSTHVVNAIVRGKAVGYDPLRDFTLLSQIASVPNVVSVHPSVPARTMAELIAHLKKNPGKLNYGTPGNGSLGHLIGETFKYATQTDVVHVPYKGAGPALTDALAGQVQVLFDNLPSSLPHIQAGKLRALAVAADKRVAALPDVPTYAELKLPALNDPSWFGLIGPARLPPQVVARVHGALVRALAQPEVLKRLEAAAAMPVGNSPDEFRRVVSEAIATSSKVATEARLKFD
ncbi:MAG TPA: tripartite tricarboxylate transporter substrate binding protein BugE [Burkholderiales bacterium]|nr:tripartite tricarboxylate transporter substrate binding protein BugE [Burkholderiales bacterium]